MQLKTAYLNNEYTKEKNKWSEYLTTFSEMHQYKKCFWIIYRIVLL